MYKFKGPRKIWDGLRRSSSLTKGIARLTGGVAVAQVISFLVYPVLTRMYDSQAFGVLAVYTSAVGLVGMVSTLRYDMAIPLPQTKQGALGVVTFALYLNASVSILFILVGALFPSLLSMLGQGEIPTYFVWLLPFGIWLAGTYKVMRMWAVRERAYKTISTTKITQTLGTSILQVGMGSLRATGISLVGSQMLGSGIGIGSIYARTIRGRGLHYPSGRETAASGKRYWRFAAMGAPSALLNSIAINSPSLLMSSFYGVAVTGQFGLAMRVIGAPITLLGNSVESAFYAEAARIGTENATRIKRMVDRLTVRLATVGSLPTLALIFWGPWLFELVFGEQWHLAGVFSSYLAIFMFFNILSMPFSSIFLLYEKLHLSLILNTIKAALAVASFALPNLLGWDATGAMIVYALALGGFYLLFGLTARLTLRMEIRRRTCEADRKEDDYSDEG